MNTTEMDRGIPFVEALGKLAEKFPQYSEPIFLWRNKWLDLVAGPITGSIRILKELHAQGYNIYVLTNFSAETFETYIRNNYTFLKYLKGIVVSGIEKITKPDLKIYKILLERYKLKPSDCVFIDDSSQNLIPAKELGMVVIKFETPEKLLSDLNKIGILRYKMSANMLYGKQTK